MKKRYMEKETVLEMMARGGAVVINDHTKKPEAITGVVEFVADKGLACMFDARYYSLNLCYRDEDDDKLHCSQMSIGGVLWGGRPDAEQLKKYNEGCCQEGGKIVCCHMADGTTIYPAK